MPLESIAVVVLSMLAAGGLAYVFIYPHMTGEVKGEKRREEITKSAEQLRQEKTRVANAQRNKRSHVEEALSELERRQQHVKNPPLHIRIEQAGLKWSKEKFIIISVLLGLSTFWLIFVTQQSMTAAMLVAFVAGLGIPRWLLHYMKVRRLNQFLDEFPNSIDVIVRGVKAGLPIGDCMKIIANEAQEPVKQEFQHIVETQTVGLPLGEACSKLFERIPLPEANFFGIVITIQQKAGGSLSEALGNLSKVLRERKKMKAKIQAMSMEAKASASIIAALPVAVMLLVYLSSPRYIEMLWTTDIGRIMLLCCAGWMLIGVLVMRKMINFDF